MKRWRRKLLWTLAAIALTVIVAAITVRVVAHSRGVVEVSVPGDSLAAELLHPPPDYADAYRCPIPPDSIRNLADLVKSQGGIPSGRSDRELVYTGRAPGLVYHVSFLLDRPEDPTTVTVSTVVHYESKVGAIYFFIVRPVHRAGIPLFVSEVVR